MKRALIALLAVTAVPCVGAGPRIDLNQPGSLEALQESNPGHFAKVSAVLRAAAKPPCDNEELRLMKARHELRHIACGFLLLTSFPAQRRVNFVLDDTHYYALVRLTSDPGRITHVDTPR
jgi:hypothetical protein